MDFDKYCVIMVITVTSTTRQIKNHTIIYQIADGLSWSHTPIASVKTFGSIKALRLIFIFSTGNFNMNKTTQNALITPIHIIGVTSIIIFEIANFVFIFKIHSP